MSSSARLLILVIIVAALIAGAVWWRSGRTESLVVYCAHDAIFAEEILRGFEHTTGKKLAVRYDTEATKSLGLVELLIGEREAPRCDVFWNNEVLGTMDLAERGILAPHRGPGWERIPAGSKDPDARWTGFAARMRVAILSDEILPAEDAGFSTLARGEDLPSVPLSFFAIAKPLFGTTLTHYVVLWKLRGGDWLKAWHRETRERGLREVNGNSAVKDLVAAGTCPAGFTDTDDFFVAKDAGAPVHARPIEIATAAGPVTICIPNAVALIRGAPHPAAARELIEHLLSAETELALAKSKSRQIPLGPVAPGALPAEVAELKRAAEKAIPLSSLLEARAECLAWLKSEYAR